MLILKQLARDYNITQNEMARILCTDQSQVSKMMNGLREIKREHIALLESHFGKEVVAKYDVSNEQFEAWRSQIARPFSGTILPAEIVEEIKEEETEEANLIVPYVSKDIVQSRDTNIRELVLTKSSELKYLALSELFGDFDYVQKVITSAMMSTFQPGDRLFIKYLSDSAKIVSGALYLIDTRLYGAMVRQVTVDGDYFRLTSTNPDFLPLEVHRSDVYSVGIVQHLLRSDFNLPLGFPDLTNQISRRDDQIDNLIEQIDKAGERESRLIKLLEDKH